MTLFLPVGPPASGKSTLVDLLVESGWLDGDAVVSPDNLRRVLTGDRARQDENHTVFKIAETVAQTRLSYGLDVWYDATNLVPSWYEDLAKWARFYGEPILCIYFDTEDAECHRRNAERQQPVPNEVMEIMLERRRQMSINKLPGMVLAAREFLFQVTYSRPMS